MPKSLSCGGLPMADAHFEKLCASNGISGHLTQFREVEEYRVQLSDVTVLELVILPYINRGTARASVKGLRVS